MGRRDFGRYKIVEEVGRGAMGVVYRATDPLVRRTVAIKAINASYLEGVGVKANEFFERFRREAEVAGRLNHPHIVKIFDLGRDYMVMEFVEGQSLDSLLRAKIRLTPGRILEVVGEVASALDYAHGLGIVHRDIKPGNVMIQPDGTAKVMDFGLARVESSTLTAAGEILGSASYMAPEVVLGRPADARADVFSLGVVAYEMMTGDRPFGGTSVSVIIQNIVRMSPRPARQINGRLPPEYDSIFERVLAKEPGARHDTASDFAAELALRSWDEPGGTSFPAAAAKPGPADDGAATIPPGVRPVAPRGAPTAARPTGAGASGDEDEGGATVLMAEAGEVGSEDEDAGSTTVLMADASEVGPAVAPPDATTLPPAATTIAPHEPAPTVRMDVAELPPGSLEPIEAADETPLSALVETQPPPSEIPTETQRPGSDIQIAAKAAAAAGMGPSDVLGGPPLAPTSGPQAPSVPPVTLVPGSVPSTRRRGVPLVAILGVGALLFLGLALALSVVAYRMLVQRTARPAESPPETIPETTPEPQAHPPVSPAPESLAAEPASSPEVVAPTVVAPALVSLRVASEPAGARVVIGRAARGVTPLRLQLPPGRVSVTVEKDGFKPWKREVSLRSGSLALDARLEAVPKASPTLAPTPTPAGVRAGDLMPLGPGVTPPKRLSGESPRLPSGASKKMKLSGSVLLEFVVDENGKVTDARVAESAGDVLDAACLEAVRGWRYEPATTQGVRVKVVQRAKFTFQAR